MKKRVLAGLAFVAAALALILILSIFRSTARAADSEPEQVGFLLIAGKVPPTEAPRHPVLTFRGVDPARCVGIEAPEEDERVEIEDSTQGEDSAKSQLMTEPETHEERTEPELERTACDSEPILRYLGEYKITGYDTCARCCGNTRGITASGTTATVGRTCAAPKDLPFGTRLWIEGIGERIVEDRGGAVHGKKIDVLCADHPACYAITGYYDVYIIEEVQE